MAINSNDLAQITARLGMLRLGTGRLGAVEIANRLKSNGEFIWNRTDAGDPDDTVAGWTTVRS